MMLQQMTCSELQEALDYAAIEPYGEFRAELRNGALCSLTANINRDPEKRSEPFTALDFMHYIDKPEEPELTPEECFDKIDKLIFGL
jgi:hypothetical protein